MAKFDDVLAAGYRDDLRNMPLEVVRAKRGACQTVEAALSMARAQRRTPCRGGAPVQGRRGHRRRNSLAMSNGDRVVRVVDDDEMIRRLVRTVLEADDFKVVEAEGGEQALEMIESKKPSVVVLDIMMPGVDGVEVCRRLDHSDVKV